MHKTITIKQAEEVIEYIDDHIDCEVGLSWMTVECAIEEILQKPQQKISDDPILKQIFGTQLDD